MCQFICVLCQIYVHLFFFLMIRRPPRSTHCISSAASDVYKRQDYYYLQTILNDPNLQYVYYLYFYLQFLKDRPTNYSDIQDSGLSRLLQTLNLLIKPVQEIIIPSILLIEQQNVVSTYCF
eukprot:TRINITY_DN26705_c0_g1_i1.p2 TRINITY_DN26705_c0_g1~~TRINITY_DN26705_c0_g1_i1.p2  ORF type:complete len:121 (+),score=17.97 TRINITY_DN26705_c0_g1_i1:66-428(+)